MKWTTASRADASPLLLPLLRRISRSASRFGVSYTTDGKDGIILAPQKVTAQPWLAEKASRWRRNASVQDCAQSCISLADCFGIRHIRKE